MSTTNAELSKKLDTVLVSLTVLDQQHRTLMELVEKHELTLNGNGQKGLKTRVEVIEGAVTNASGWVKVLVGAAFVQILVIAVGLLTHTIKLVP